MGSVTINGRTITWEDSKRYRTIDAVGSGHGGGDVLGVSTLNLRLLFYDGRTEERRPINEFEIAQSHGAVRAYLRDKRLVHNPDLTEPERPDFERTLRLYEEILTALGQEEMIERDSS